MIGGMSEARLFTGHRPVDPGAVFLRCWHPDRPVTEAANLYGGVDVLDATGAR